jgi:hypothetical protein
MVGGYDVKNTFFRITVQLLKFEYIPSKLCWQKENWRNIVINGRNNSCIESKLHVNDSIFILRKTVSVDALRYPPYIALIYWRCRMDKCNALVPFRVSTSI